MGVIDDIIGIQESNKQSKSTNNSSKWKQEQNELRQWCYNNMDNMALQVKDDGDLFKKYMDIQSRFEKHSVGNSLLILKQNPNTTQFKDKKSWKEAGVSLVATPEKFVILEPTKTEDKVYYNPKEEYDITQTNARPEEKRQYSIRKLLEAIVYNCYAEIKPVDELPDKRIGIANYDKEENILYIVKGINEEQLFQILSYCVADIEMRNIKDSQYKDFKNQCVSYMICKKYNVNAPNYDFSIMPIEISTLETGKEVRDELDTIRVNFEAINERMQEGMEHRQREKKPKQKEQER